MSTTTSTADASPDPHITELGTGEPALVLLSGLGDPAAWWFSVPTPEEALPHWQGNAGTRRPGTATALASLARVAAYDRAGVGKSAAPDHDRTWAELYAELTAVIGTLKLSRPPVLVGHSLGGLIAFSYARRFPAAIGGLVLLDPTPPPLVQPPPGPMPERLALLHFGPDEVAEAALGQLPLLLIAPGRPLAITDILDRTDQRTQAMLDTRFARRRAQHHHLLATSARSRAVWTPFGGHYVHLDSPDLVTAIIRRFWIDVSEAD